jgi:hypothetical protein
MVKLRVKTVATPMNSPAKEYHINNKIGITLLKKKILLNALHFFPA